jgi:hypothetical protein
MAVHSIVRQRRMFHLTAICAFGGIGVSALGIHGLRYMQARVLGGWNRVQVAHDLTERYRALVRESNAPLWPLITYRVCMPLGVVITFSSILWIR